MVISALDSSFKSKKKNRTSNAASLRDTKGLRDTKKEILVYKTKASYY